MISFLKKLKHKKSVALLGTVLMLTGCTTFGTSNGNNPQSQKFQVQPVTLQQSVAATGFLQPTTSIDLSFHSSGEVAQVKVAVGDHVKKDQLLASLKNNDQKAALDQVQGILAEARASLNLKLAKATDQDIEIANAEIHQAEASKDKTQVDLDNAITDLENTKKNVALDNKTAELALEDAKLTLQKTQVNSSSTTTQNSSSVDNATISLKNALGQLLVAVKAELQNIDKIFGIQGQSVFANKQGSSFIISSLEYNNARTLYMDNLKNYQTLSQAYDALPTTPKPADLADMSIQAANLIKNMNDGIFAATTVLNLPLVTSTLTFVESSEIKADISVNGSSFNTAASSYSATKTAFDTALISQTSGNSTSPLNVQSSQLLVDQQQQNLEKVQLNGTTSISNKQTVIKSLQAQLKVDAAAVEKAQAALDGILAAPRAVDIAPYQARVTQAKGQVAQAQNVYDNTLLKAPFDGTITEKNIDTGEEYLISSGALTKSALAMIDTSQFHIDVDIPETQISQISTDSKVSVTFDALGEAETFEGKILSIEPASTNVQGIVYFKAKIALVKNDPRLKVGMTANVIIDSGTQDNVLAIPEKAITTVDGKTYVMSADNKQIEIQSGVRGGNGLIEIVSGLHAGDTILVPLN